MLRTAIAVMLLVPTVSWGAPEKGGKGKGKGAGFDPVWSLGGHVGTNFLPGAYPLGFPPKINSSGTSVSGSNCFR